MLPSFLRVARPSLTTAASKSRCVRNTNGPNVGALLCSVVVVVASFSFTLLVCFFFKGCCRYILPFSVVVFFLLSFFCLIPFRMSADLPATVHIPTQIHSCAPQHPHLIPFRFTFPQQNRMGKNPTAKHCELFCIEC